MVHWLDWDDPAEDVLCRYCSEEVSEDSEEDICEHCKEADGGEAAAESKREGIEEEGIKEEGRG